MNARTYALLFSASALLYGDPVLNRLEVLPNGRGVRLVFTERRWPEDFTGARPAADCELLSPPGLRSRIRSLTPSRIEIVTNTALPPGATVRVFCKSVGYIDASGQAKELTNVEMSTVVPTVASVNEWIEERVAAAREESKKVSEKDIFASGFVTTASEGSAGGADISLNPDFKIPGLTSFLQIKKTTQEGGDAKHFEAGARFQSFFVSNRKALAGLRELEDQSLTSWLQHLRDNRSGYAKAFTGSTLDIAFKMEGTPSDFAVTNLVGETGYTLRTVTAPLFGRRGFIRGFFTPVAFEGGESNARIDAAAAAGQPTTEIKPDWIARYKGGLGFRMFYEDPASPLPIMRVELAGEGVIRNLFRDEYMWDAEKKEIGDTGKGLRGYGQVDLKLYMGESDAGRYGVKLSYNRGSLPPVFARVKSFQFGFLWESKDGDQ